MVLRHEAAQMGIRPGTAEIAKAIKSLPAFGAKTDSMPPAIRISSIKRPRPMGFSEARSKSSRRTKSSLNG